ncbi:MAG: class I adenylate-forming enzyme family protein, partial [Nocardioidaceae bacterium]
MILEFAAALAGAVLVSISPSITETDQVADALARSHTKALFYQEETGDITAVVRQLRPRLPELRTAIPFSRWADFMNRADPDRPLPQVSPDATAHIVFTSGTTGRSTGVVHRHQAIVNNARFTFQRIGLGRGETLLPYVPMHHGTACGLCVPGSAWHRATLVLPEALAPGPVSELLETYRAEMLFTAPARLTVLTEDPDVGRRDLRALRTVVTATAPSPPELIRTVEAEFGCRVVNVYGQTEASAIAAQDPADAVADAIGRPLPQLECKIVDLATERITGIDVPGELCVRGYQVMVEYLGAPEETANRIDPDGWLRTGDVATMDERGVIAIAGRIRDVITKDGERIYPREVENHLAGHPGVGDAIVLGVPDPRWGQQVVAVIRPAAGSSPTPAELRAYCLRHLAPYMAPAEWYYVDSLPLCGP